MVSWTICINKMKKSQKFLHSFVVQHCEVTMVNAQFSKHVASLETREGCPITPGASFSKTFFLVPIASSNKDRRGKLNVHSYWNDVTNSFKWIIGIALDGHLKEDDVNLASSTMGSEGKTTVESLGIVISYSLRVKLNCGTLGGELQTDVPFKLMNPAPGKLEKRRKNNSRRVLRFEINLMT